MVDIYEHIYPFGLGHSFIVKIEEAFQVELPSDYKDFLKSVNGGCVNERVSFRSLHGGDKAVGLESFSGVVLLDGEISLSSFSIEEPAIDSLFLCVGYDGCGNYLMLRKEGADAGKVYWLDCDTEDEIWDVSDVDRDDCEVEWCAFYLVQNSFQEFLDASIVEEQGDDDY